MTLKLGLQMWSVRSSMEKDLAGTLAKIAEMGYKNVQVNAFTVTPEGLSFGKDVSAAEMRKQLDLAGLTAVSAHYVEAPGMRIEAIANDLKTLGVDNIALAIQFWPTKSAVEDWLKSFNKHSEEFKKNGIQLYYHNHFHEFQVFGGKSVFEMLLDETDKDLVKIEFDTFWAVRGGQDPIYWMKKMGTRCGLVHQKDLPASVKTVNLFERLGYDSELGMAAMMNMQDPNEYTEVGDGVLNIPGIINAARTYCNSDYIFVEQDMSARTELESVEISLKRMNTLLA